MKPLARGERVKRHIVAQRFSREYIKNGYNATRAYQTIRPYVTEGSAAVEGHRLLRKPQTMEAIALATAKILTAEEVKERISSLADSSKLDRDKLKALELMGKVHAILTDRSINDNRNTDATRLDDMREQAIREAEEAFKALTGLAVVTKVDSPQASLDADSNSESTGEGENHKTSQSENVSIP